MGHEVIVGNVGTVLHTYDGAEAERIFNKYVEISKAGHGRAGGEPVTWMVDGDIHQEYVPEDPGEHDTDAH